MKRKNIHSTIERHLKQAAEEHFFEAVRGNEYWRLRLRVRRTLEVESAVTLPRLATNNFMRTTRFGTRRSWDDPPEPTKQPSMRALLLFPIQEDVNRNLSQEDPVQ